MRLVQFRMVGFEPAHKCLNSIPQRPQHRARRTNPPVVLALVGHDAFGLHLPHGDALVNGRKLPHALTLV